MNRWDSIGALAVMAGVMVFMPMSLRASKVDKVLEAKLRANQAAAKSQESVSLLSDETTDLLAEYRAVLEQVDALERYQGQLETLLKAQETEMVNLDTQIQSVTTTGRQLLPLMANMLEGLEAFVGLDVPFLKAEREERLASLKAMMGRADVTNAEKFRRLLEAYQVENDYGRTLETYQGELPHSDVKRTVSFLRIGRVLLAYQTIDGEESGIWVDARKTWEPLPSAYRATITKALRIARRQAPPDLLRLPVPAPEVIK